MANIWKVGSWPGIRMKKSRNSSKKEYIYNHALPKGFVAIGYGWIPDLRGLDERGIKKYIQKRKLGAVERRVKEILSFSRILNVGDIVLLYSRFKVFVGLVTRNYYFVKRGSRNDFIKCKNGVNRAPHRVGVAWLFNKRAFNADFSCWQDTIHQINNCDLRKVSNSFLRKFIKLSITKEVSNV